MIFRFDKIPSTQDVLKDFYKSGEATFGDVAIAWSQKNGRGRYGKSFHSPGGRGIYLSVLLHYINPERLTVRAAAAVLRAIEQVTGAVAQVEWVNDVLIGGKKISGILAEAISGDDGKPGAVVLGVGLNVAEPESGFPKDIQSRAGALLSAAEVAAMPAEAFEEMRSNLTDALIEQLLAIDAPDGASQDIELYRSRIINTCDMPADALESL